MILDVTAQFPLTDLRYRWEYPSLDDITDIAIHHTVTLFLAADATLEDELNQINVIYIYHRDVRGYGGLGYHGISFASGRTYKTAPWDRLGANVYRENDHIHGFAVAGDFTNTVPPKAQQQGIAELILASWEYVGRENPQSPHGQWVDSTCPGNTHPQWVPGLDELARQMKEDPNMAWSRWQNMGGQAVAGPAVASWAKGRLDIFCVGNDKKLRHRWYKRGSGWSAWENLGAPRGVQLTDTPAAISWDEDRIDVFVTGQDKKVYHLWWNK